MADAKKTQRFDYDRPIEGLAALDRYTLRIRLNNTDFGFPFVLALPATAAVAREVREYYGDDFHAHPVGTGPYLLKEWVRGSRVVLEANPDFARRSSRARGRRRDSKEIAARLRGKRIPIVGRVEIYVIDEGAAALALPPERRARLHPAAAGGVRADRDAGRELAPNLRKKGMHHARRDRLHHVHDLQPAAGDRRQEERRGGYAPSAWRCAARSPWRTASTSRSRSSTSTSRRAPTRHSPAVAGYDPEVREPDLEYNSGEGEGAPRHVRLRRPRRDGYREP
jgi:hypothetical protein